MTRRPPTDGGGPEYGTNSPSDANQSAASNAAATYGTNGHYAEEDSSLTRIGPIPSGFLPVFPS
jgi:hypothetical protein